MLVLEMDIPTRMKNVLIRKHITDSDSITDELINGLMNEQGIGKVSVEALREAMKALAKPSEIIPKNIIKVEVVEEAENSNSLSCLEDLPLSPFARFIASKIIGIIETNVGIRKSSYDTSTVNVDVYINKKYVFIEQHFATSTFFTYKKGFIPFEDVRSALNELMDVGLIDYSSNNIGERFVFSRYNYLFSKANFLRIELEKLSNMLNREVVPAYPFEMKKKIEDPFITFGDIIKNKISNSDPVKADDLLKQEAEQQEKQEAEQEIKKEKKRDTEYSVFISQYLSVGDGCNVTCKIYKKHPVTNGYIMVEIGLAIYDSATGQVDIISKDTLSAGEIKAKIKEVI